MSSPRVAYLLKKFPRLSETFVLNEILQQERLGTDVTVFSRRPHDAEPRHPEFARLKARIEMMAAQDSMEPWLDMFAGDDEARRLLDRFGSLVRELSVHQHARMPGLFAEALLFLRKARENAIDHVHVHFATDSAMVAMIAQDLGGPGYSVTAHAKDIYRSTVDPRLLSRVVERSRFTVTVCDANVRHLRDLLSPAAFARVRRLYNGVDLELFQPRPEVRRDELHVLCVARLVEKKGFPVLVEALSTLRGRGVPARATFVGEGEDRTLIEAHVAERGLRDVVTLTGALDQDAVRGLLSRATVMCLPCVVGEDGNRDALPTTLIEALASGLPCVSTPVTGIPEILGHGAAGVLVPEDDARATADALEMLLGDGALRARFARAGVERAHEHFDGRQSARTLRSWFDEVALPVGAT